MAQRMVRTGLLALMLPVLLALGGCNTVEGLGQDIKKGGEAVEDAATSVKKKL